jgi:hypothetical protein
MQRLVTLQAATSGVFHIFPVDPRNEHNFPRLWKAVVPVPVCIASTVSDMLDNMQFLITIQDRAREGGNWPVTRDRPGILLTVDADDILVRPGTGANPSRRSQRAAPPAPRSPRTAATQRLAAGQDGMAAGNRRCPIRRGAS